MLIQFDLNDLHTAALDYAAVANGMSRRAYVTQVVEEALDNSPGLMERIREIKNSGVKIKGKVEVPEQKSILIPEAPPERLKRYRFRPLDGSSAIEGIGASAGSALTQATGRVWTQPEYAEVYMTPEMVGYEDEL